MHLKGITKKKLVKDLCYLLIPLILIFTLFSKTGNIIFIVAPYLISWLVYSFKYQMLARHFLTKSETNFPIKIYSDDAKPWLGKSIREADQGQFVFAQDEEVLATGHVLQCNLLFGWCEDLKLAFLCHADLPMSVRGIKEFFEQLERRVLQQCEKLGDTESEKSYTFRTTILGGQTWWVYPYQTRIRLIRSVENSNLQNINFDLDIAEMPTSFRTFSLSMCAQTGCIDGYIYNAEKAKRLGCYLHESEAVVVSSGESEGKQRK